MKKCISNVLSFLKRNSIIPILLAIFIVFSIFGKSFFTASNLLNILMQSSVYGVMAVGMTFLIVTGYFDLSAGVVMGLCANIVIILQQAGLPIMVAVLLTLVIAAGIGLFIGLMVTKAHINAFIVTLAVMISGRGLTYLISGANQLAGPNMSFANYANGKIFGISYLSITFIVVLVIGVLLLQFSTHGRDTYAIGGNCDAAFNAGIKVDRVKTWNFVICSFCCGLAGIMTASRMNAATPFLGYPDGAIMTITCVVLGGTSLLGGSGGALYTLGGTIAYFMFRNGLNTMNVSSGYYLVLTGMILIVIVAFERIKGLKREGAK